MKNEIAAMFNATAAPLRFPTELKERVHRYVRQHQGGALVSEQAPFRRQLDLWAAAIAVACARGLEPREGPASSWGDKFVDTRAVQLDPALADLLVILAARDYGVNDERLTDPAEVMELANRYAASGAKVVLGWLEDPSLRQTNVEKVISGLKDARRVSSERAGIPFGAAKSSGDRAAGSR